MTRVAVAGKGHLGSAVLDQLLKAGFAVTILSRSKLDTIPGANVIQVDYSSIESLSAALQGHDAVVSTVGPTATLVQTNIIDAAIIAGVKRFVPSDFSSITTDPRAKDIPVFQHLIQIQDYLKDRARAGEIEYSIISPGPFLEYVFGSPLFIDFRKRAVLFHGDGNVRVSTTSIAGIGKAVAGTLQNLDQTENRVVYAHEAVITQKSLLELARRASSDESQWNENTVDPQVALQEATERFTRSPSSFLSVLGLIKAEILSGNYKTEYAEVDNDLLGLKLLSTEELERVCASFCQQTRVI